MIVFYISKKMFLMGNYTGYTDETLSGLLKDGDHAAFNEIWDRYKSKLYTFTLRMLGDREASRDLVSDLFVSIWSKRDAIKLSSSLSSYLYVSARNRAFDLISRRKVEGRYIDSFQDYLDRGEDNADHLIRSKEMAAMIDAEIHALPEKMREIFLLSRETQLSRAEISQRLGVSEETVKNQMHKALKLLKSRLGAAFILIFF